MSLNQFKVRTRHNYINAPEVPKAVLSKREMQCLDMLAKGLRYQQIAYELGTSVRTVEKQISSARIKLNASTIPQAVAIAVSESIVRL